jgi:hypothetical protein
VESVVLAIYVALCLKVGGGGVGAKSPTNAGAVSVMPCAMVEP